MSRYDNRKKVLNNSEMYEGIFKKRGVKHIKQFATLPLKYPNDDALLRINTFDHTWSQGDKFWRLAEQQYGDSRLWWVIAQFNKKPTENHVKLGEIIKIPIDLSVVLGVLG